MKKTVYIILLSVLVILSVGCTPTPEDIEGMLQQTATAEALGISLELTATAEALPTSTPKPGNTSMGSSSSGSNGTTLGEWYDTWGFVRTIIISKVGDVYKMKEIYADGSGGTSSLGVRVVDGQTRLYETENSFGDYMIIMNNGNLAFYDNQGLIYEIKPSSSSSSSSTSTSSSSSSPSSSSSICDTLWRNFDLAMALSGGETTDLSATYMLGLMENNCFD